MIDYEKVSVIGRINRFFGQVDVAELNSFSDMVHALWLQHVKQGWALYLYTDDVSLGVIFLKQHCFNKEMVYYYQIIENAANEALGKKCQQSLV